MDKHVCSRCNRTLASRQSLRYHEQRRFPCKAATSTVAAETKMKKCVVPCKAATSTVAVNTENVRLGLMRKLLQ